MVLLLALSSLSYGQFVEKKKADSTKVDSAKKVVKKEPVKPVTNSIVKVVKEEAYDIPKRQFGVQIVPQLGNPLLLEVSPFVAIKLGKKTLGGLGLTYAFSQVSVNGVSTNASHFGARTFIQFYPTKYFFAHGEIEGMSLENTTSTIDPNTGLATSTSNRETILNLLVGAGLRYPISSKFALQAMVLYDMNRRTAGAAGELHSNPVFRIGLTF
ncbi:hypothetical protein BKI52_42635 [marine bacterium AO1-C]|nr:hypothetical protein BKI52_42635 [marine bacterium AO1-C]